MELNYNLRDASPEWEEIEEDKKVLRSGSDLEEDKRVLRSGSDLEEDKRVLRSGSDLEEDKKVLRRSSSDLREFILISDEYVKFIHRSKPKGETCKLKKDFIKEEVEDTEELVNKLLERDAELEPIDRILEDLDFRSIQSKKVNFVDGEKIYNKDLPEKAREIKNKDKIIKILKFIQNENKSSAIAGLSEEIESMIKQNEKIQAGNKLSIAERLAVEGNYRHRTIDLFKYATRLINGRSYKHKENIPERLR